MLATPASAAPADAADPALTARIATSLARQGLMQHLNARLERVAVGEVEMSLPFSDRVTQQQGTFHAGAITALADDVGGYAGLTVAPEGFEVVSVEFKINLLKARAGGRLFAIGKVAKAGRQLIITTAEVTHVADDGTRTPCALMQQTLALVPQKY